MKKTILFILAILITTVSLNAQQTEQKSLSVTVYNQNFGVIKDLRTANLEKGISKLAITDVAQSIIPASVHIGFGGEVLEQNYQYDLVNIDAILNKYIDKNIQLFSDKNELIEGTLLSSRNGQIVLKKKDGGLLMIPSFGNYKVSAPELPAGLITKPTLLWMLNTLKSGKQDLNITYQTTGLNWNAEYAAVLNDKDDALDIKAWVNIQNNTGTEFKDAELKLVAGNVNFSQEKSPAMYKNAMYEVTTMTGNDRQFEEKSFFEYHIYNLQRKTTLANFENKQVSLFDAQNVGAVKKYIYSDKNWNDGKVNVIVEFENSEKNNLGMPFPQGKVRLYKSDGKSVEFIGEDNVEHTPKNEKIKLKVGSAFDIVAETKTTESKQITDRIHEYVIEITLKNRKDEDVVVEVERAMWNNWEVLSSSLNFEKKDAYTITFKVPVKKDSETVLKYKIRNSY